MEEILTLQILNFGTLYPQIPPNSATQMEGDPLPLNSEFFRFISTPEFKIIFHAAPPKLIFKWNSRQAKIT